jgi:iron complex transport system permease protein
MVDLDLGRSGITDERRVAEGAILRDLMAIAGRRRRRLAWTFALLIGATVVAALLSIAIGAHAIPLPKIPAILIGAVPTDRDTLVVLSIRLPRAVATLLVGASLAVSGVLMQGLFRNPLADPGLLGVSSGAALAAAAVIVLGDRLAGGALPFEALPIAAFGGAVLATLLLALAGRRAGRTDTGAVLLAGIAFAALANAALGLLVYVADDRQLRDLTFWTLGSFGGVGWGRLMISAPLLLAPVLLAPLLGPAFDALAFGEAEAHHMGIRVERVKRIAIAATALGVGAAVATVGIVGFVGMVVPHGVRLTIGPSHRALLPASALAGALLTLAADLTARTIVAPAELPIGILTALVGAPVFLHLVARRRGGLAS